MEIALAAIATTVAAVATTLYKVKPWLAVARSPLSDEHDDKYDLEILHGGADSTIEYPLLDQCLEIC